MKFFAKSCLLLAVLGLVATFSSTANAQRGHGFRAAPYWGSHGYANRRTLPYFALHPPVYYSHPVARPYGYSPFALPPGMMPAEFKAPSQPEEIINPHYQPKAKKEKAKEEKKASNRTARVQIIENPYYRPSRAKSDSRLASDR